MRKYTSVEFKGCDIEKLIALRGKDYVILDVPSVANTGDLEEDLVYVGGLDDKVLFIYDKETTAEPHEVYDIVGADTVYIDGEYISFGDTSKYEMHTIVSYNYKDYLKVFKGCPEECIVTITAEKYAVECEFTEDELHSILFHASSDLKEKVKSIIAEIENKREEDSKLKE